MQRSYKHPELATKLEQCKATLHLYGLGLQTICKHRVTWLGASFFAETVVFSTDFSGALLL